MGNGWRKRRKKLVKVGGIYSQVKANLIRSPAQNSPVILAIPQSSWQGAGA
jgi:hypothetical protein